MRFSANLSMLFKEVPFLDRFERAARAGFTAVEFWWPTEALEDVAAAVESAGVEVALFNFDAGDLPSGDRGLLSDPARAERFRDNVPVALELARRLGCTRLNALVGKGDLGLAAENVAWAAAQTDAEVLIEACNTIENPGYLLDTTRAALDFAERVGAPNVRLQYDAYHMQRMEGNLVATLTEHIGRIGHIQVADSPGRGEPGSGEINYAFVLDAIERLGYDGYVGLEYNPTTGTEESLGWMCGSPAA